MTQIKTESRLYPNNKNGQIVNFKVRYELEFKDNVLHTVRNEFGFPIEKDSECFEYFKSKYI